MDWVLIAYVVTGAAAGGFVNGLAGFGTALMSLGIWLQVMPAEQAVPIVSAMSVISGLQSLWFTRHTLSKGIKRLPRFLLPALAGLGIGSMALGVIEPRVIKLTIAGLMILYTIFFTMRSKLPQFTRDHPAADSCIGLMSGVLGGAASLSGVLPTMWCALQPWNKYEVSALLRPFNITVLGIAVIVYCFRGFYDMQSLMMMALALPSSIIATQIGVRLFKRISDTQFRFLLVFMMLLGAVSIILREVFLSLA